MCPFSIFLQAVADLRAAGKSKNEIEKFMCAVHSTHLLMLLFTSHSSCRLWLTCVKSERVRTRLRSSVCCSFSSPADAAFVFSHSSCRLWLTRMLLAKSENETV
jgi:hypothetical protein